jgi:phytanoyl-CoA hydroxylase
MIELRTPRGLPVPVPETLSEGPTPRFRPDQLSEIYRYYDEQGYAVVSGVVDAGHCDHLRGLWETEVKTTGQFIYRQATAEAERHVCNERGWVMNPILNLQSVDPRRLGEFRHYATEKILTAPLLARVFEALLGDRPKIVQSMYFEGNSVTWEHQDSYYLDSENIGRMAAAWIALEPIEAEAGRFFICPGSHRLVLNRHGSENDDTDNLDRYFDAVVAKVRELGLEIHAPRLETGDALFWNAWTIHGSLDSQHVSRSRSSVTCHAIAARDRFFQLRLRPLDVETDIINGVHIYRPKDLARFRNRAVLWLESRFPRQFYWLKRAAIRRLAAKTDQAHSEIDEGEARKRGDNRTRGR